MEHAINEMQSDLERIAAGNSNSSSFCVVVVAGILKAHGWKLLIRAQLWFLKVSPVGGMDELKARLKWQRV